ncbi:hypothetical protein [Antrihabitans cavernicola]|nr:hypothetical protein [Spelaeibacter cavernicola]
MIPPPAPNLLQFLIDLVGFAGQMIPRTPELLTALVQSIQALS